MSGIYLKASAYERKCLTVKIESIKKKFLKMIFVVAAVYVSVQAVIQSGMTVGNKKSQTSFSGMFWESIAMEIEEGLYSQYMPGVLFAKEMGTGTNWLIQKQIDSLTPLYGYLAEDITAAKDQEQVNTGETIQSDKNGEKTEVDVLELGLEDMLDGEEKRGQFAEGELAEALTELVKAENAAVEQAENPTVSGFVPNGKLAQVDLALLGDYETLLQQFYTVDANTSASSERLNVERFLEKDMRISKEEGPQILIFHTHSQEGFADSVPGDESTTIIGVGEKLKQLLEETYGYQVLHHTGKYDVDSRNDAYSEALPEVEQILKDNPSIQVVIDLHRDSMPEGTKLVMDLNGRPTARFMFFNGLSRTRTTGNISYLYNENLDANLAFSFQMQLAAAEYYPGLTRKIYLKGYRYNMHLKDKYLLVELGAQNNTVEEAMNACDPLAHILDLVLSGSGQ